MITLWCLVLLVPRKFSLSSYDWFQGAVINADDVFREQLLTRISECRRLNEEYQRQFHKTRGKLRENPNGRQFEFRLGGWFNKFMNRYFTFCSLDPHLNFWYSDRWFTTCLSSIVSTRVASHLARNDIPNIVVTPWVQSPSPKSPAACISEPHVHCMHIHQSGRSVKKYECKKYEKNHRFMRMKMRT